MPQQVWNPSLVLFTPHRCTHFTHPTLMILVYLAPPEPCTLGGCGHAEGFGGIAWDPQVMPEPLNHPTLPHVSSAYP
jgi:hypothetical protein